MNTLMKYIKIRQGAFETNSSSTHALVVKKQMPTELPKFAYFGLGEFGWEQAKYRDSDTKCTYLNTALYNRFIGYEGNPEKYNEYKDRISALLADYGIITKWKDISLIPKDKQWEYYIDHCDELDTFIALVISKPELLVEWLFNDESELVTDNDNSEMEYYEEAFNTYGNKEDYWVYGKSN